MSMAKSNEWSITFSKCSTIFSGSSMIFAATNHQYILDPALWRRFDDVIYYELPDLDARRALFERYLKPIRRKSDIDLDILASRSANLSPSDIKMVAEEAIKLTILGARSEVSMEELRVSLDKFLLRENVREAFIGGE